MKFFGERIRIDRHALGDAFGNSHVVLPMGRTMRGKEDGIR